MGVDPQHILGDNPWFLFHAPFLSLSFLFLSRKVRLRVWGAVSFSNDTERSSTAARFGVNRGLRMCRVLAYYEKLFGLTFHRQAIRDIPKAVSFETAMVMSCP